MSKEQLLTKIKKFLQEKTVTEEEIMAIIAKTRCYFCQNPVADKKYYQCRFWNENKNDERLVCYVCLKYSYKRNLPLISEKNKEIYEKYEREKLFSTTK